jgi:hypothetical protein
MANSYPMRDLRAIDTDTLLDLLAEYSAEYTMLLKDQAEIEEVDYVRELVDEITSEIQLRRTRDTAIPPAG